MTSWAPTQFPTGAALSPGVVPATRRKSRAENRQFVALLLGGHVVFGLLLELVPALATVHAWGAFFVVLGLALSRSTPAPAVYGVAYLAGAELLWRIQRATVFWEFGKYSVSAVAIAVLLRFGLRRGLAPLSFLYLVTLVPAMGVTLAAYGFSNATREALSFSLSGPVSLAILVALFSGLDSRWLSIERLLLSLLAPLVGVLTLVIFETLQAGAIQFSEHSNFATSAGYGPNQTSAILGLGAFVALILSLHERDYQLRFLYLGTAALFVGSSILTFSRGGAFNMVVCVSAWGVHYLAQRQMRRILSVAALALLVLGLVFFPRINAWTQGALGDRYASLETTGRAEIASADLAIFRKNLAFGVGAGRSAVERQKYVFKRVASHTEYTRLLSEHGVWGVATMVLLATMALAAYRRAPNAVSRGWVAGCTGWSLASMAHVSMRVAAVSLLFALGTLYWPREGPGEGG